jgi:hypothetical protein
VPGVRRPDRLVTVSNACFLFVRSFSFARRAAGREESDWVHRPRQSVVVRLPRYHAKRCQSCVRSHVLRPSRLLELPFVYSTGAFHRLLHSVFAKLVRDAALIYLGSQETEEGTGGVRDAALQYIC